MNNSIEELKRSKAHLEATVKRHYLEYLDRERQLKDQIRDIERCIEVLDRPRKYHALRALIGSRVSHNIWLSISNPYHIFNGRSGILVSVDDERGRIDFGQDENGRELGEEYIRIANIVIPSEAEGIE